MNCRFCNSKRVLEASGKCSDCFGCSIGGVELVESDYVPEDLGIGGGDYMEICVCLDCGKMQNDFPLPFAECEKDVSDEEIKEFFLEHFTPGAKFMGINMYDKKRIFIAAKEIGNKFLFFVKDFYNCNCYEDDRMVIPTVEQFINMYRSNSPALEQS